MRSIFQIFARSPFEPLSQHATQVREVVDQLSPLMEAMLGEDWDQARAIYERISRLEHKADELKAEIRDHLPRSLFLPVDRGDLLRFLKEQDAIADSVEDLAVLVTMRETPTPEAMQGGVRALVAQVLKAADVWSRIVADLPQLQESSFTGPEVAKVLGLIQQLNHEEWEADKLQADLGRATVAHEEALGAVSVNFWMRIAGKIGDVANHAENVGDLLRLMLAKT